MKILIIGPLGAGKSTLAYQINQQFNLPRLNLDEVSRNPETGQYYTPAKQLEKISLFTASNPAWVAEGCQRFLYEKMTPDVIIDMRINRFIAVCRFTYRFFKAKKLIGKNTNAVLPVQAYHYRKPTLKKILEWDTCNKNILTDITAFLNTCPVPVLKCRDRKDYPRLFHTLFKRNDSIY